MTLDAPAVGAARLRLAGHLDDSSARDLLHAAADVVRSGCSRLVLDLDGITSWDEEATYAVVGCTRLAPWLPQGVEVVAARPVGRDLVVCSSSPGEADTMGACHAS